MRLAMLAYMFILFVVLTPGVVVNLPPRCSKYVVLVTHALIFATVWQFTNKAVQRVTEGFKSNNGLPCKTEADCNSNICYGTPKVCRPV